MRDGIFNTDTHAYQMNIAFGQGACRKLLDLLKLSHTRAEEQVAESLQHISLEVE